MPDSLRQLLLDCRRLISERGETSGPAIATAIVERLDALTDDARGRFFVHLARDFNPDPQAVLAAAEAMPKRFVRPIARSYRAAAIRCARACPVTRACPGRAGTRGISKAPRKAR